MTESDIFFRSLPLGVENNGETRVIGNETMRGGTREVEAGKDGRNAYKENVVF